MDGNRFAKTAHPPDFDVDNSARSQFNRSSCAASVSDGFIQANRCLELFLQRGVKIEVVVPKGLFDHQQIKSVELLQMFGVVEGVSRIGIAAEENFWPAVANARQDFHIPSGFAF